MKKLTSNEIRNLWFTFWKSKQHLIIPSAPLIPENDKSLLWINAGVTPLKSYFDGTLTPPSKRLASSQKCIRTNDIENVGLTARHHTFFEMLGNFSIGDYFKKEAIFWSYEFLVEWLEMDKNKLYVTVYPTDMEAYNYWIEAGISEDHIIKLEGNFWEIGPGPSGPDSEIFYDRGEKYDKDKLGIKLLTDEIENDRYIEIWNNVFSQYNAKEGVDRKNYQELPSKNIDTGMGLERMCLVLQEKETNYETDLFMPIIRKIESISGKTYHGEVAFKVIADHIRALTFALADGASFGNTKRDYVLRRLIRRAIRYGKQLGIDRPFLNELVDVVVSNMYEAYPEIKDNINIIKYKISQEEELFRRTLENGLKKLNEIFSKTSDKRISGEDAFRLYDTYGFPFELTLELAKEKGFYLSKDDFDDFMKKQQSLSSQARQKQNSMHMQNKELLDFKLPSKFVGYDKLESKSKIIAIFDNEKFIDTLFGDGYIVLDETPFYSESGGQVSDSGLIDDIKVLDLFKGPNGQVFHHVISSNPFKVGDEVIAKVDQEKRDKIRKNHSATHLLQKALRDILSTDVHQMGSYVDDERLRFDFRYEYKISRKEIVKIEKLVNDKINLNVDTKTEIMSLDDALKTNAMALFSDKYKDKVRVVTIADSVELCGGCHVSNTKDINSFAIKSLESKGSNLYRVEAATDTNINKVLFESIKPYNDIMMSLLEKAKKIIESSASHGLDLKVDYEIFNINNDAPKCYQDIIFNMEEVDNIRNIVSSLEKNYHKLRVEQALKDVDKFDECLKEVNGYNTIIMKIENYDLDALKEVVDALENKHQNCVIFIASIKGDDVNFIAKSSKNVPFDMGNLVKRASVKCLGNGGGSKTFAQGGGTDISNVDKILEAIYLIIEGKYE